jgi:U3 small nucleolar RNA-associated protein 6
MSNRALKLHPNSIALYVLAAQQELSHGSHSAVRTLLQRGIRLNPNSVDIWLEYAKMELGFVEMLRRRWETLGIKNNTTVDIEVDDQNNDAARQKVLDDEIVKEVLRDALKGNPLLHLSELVSDLCMPLPQLFLQSMLSKGFYIRSNTIQQSYHGLPLRSHQIDSADQS